MLLVKQIGKYDCLLACLATHLNYSITLLFGEEFRKHIEKEKGTHGDDFSKAFELCGLVEGKDYISHYYGEQKNSTELFKLLFGRKALLQVPSLNYENSHHMIYWDGYNIYDPSKKQTYKYKQCCRVGYVYLLTNPNH